uniref:YHS protein n=1 Tax=Dechloromonas aromatica (strain RCB) TaxID=159087 RepID=Q47DR9_DECAR
MTKAMTTSRDPVCGMNVEVAQSSLFSTHRGIVYHFCSAQCLERFNDIPALYTGSQRIADIRPIPKRRKLRLADSSELDVWRACQRLGEMMGVVKVAAENGCLLVEYDLRQTILSQIEAVAAAEGLKFKEGLHGLRRRLWKYLEAGELENAAHPSSGACCNRPPVRLR